METAPDIQNNVARNGFAIVESVLSRATVDHLLVSLERIDDTASVRKRSGMLGSLHQTSKIVR